MTSTECKCNSKTSAGAALERPRYYPRQLVTADVLTLGQDYVRNKQRIHNRMLHGWGVVCGLTVSTVVAGKMNEPWKVTVSPGYALAPSGEGILVECQKIVDLRDAGNCSDPCARPSDDPWCSDIFIPRDAGVYYVAIRYTESMVRPERVQPAGCGCDDQRCESSRLKDGYEIAVLCDCPLAQVDPPAADFASLLKCDKMACPECVESPWLGLARVEVDTDGTILLIDNCACRRLAVSFANFWWKCECAVIKLAADGATPKTVLDREKDTDVRIKADGVDSKATVTVTRGVTVKQWKQAGSVLTLTVTADKNADPGPRTIVIANPGANMAALGGVIEVGPLPGTPVVKPKRPIAPRP